MITNKHNLPESFINYYGSDTHELKPNRYSVTELLKPTREILLTRKYYNDIERDISDCIPALFGTAVHNVLETQAPNHAEISLEIDIEGVTLAGRVDLLEGDVITDYKTCSTSKIIKQDFEDWLKQGLSYAYMYYIKSGIITRKLRFIALMKDWSKVKASIGNNYPSTPVYVWEYDIADSDYDYIERFIRGKIREIKNGVLPECSDSERWYTGDTYAVYKNVSDKRATYVSDNYTDANNYITNRLGGTGEIRVRKGENIKCNYYCDLCKYCMEERKNGNGNQVKES